MIALNRLGVKPLGIGVAGGGNASRSAHVRFEYLR